MEGAPTLLFCVGATKAGTSWLHDYLARHPDCHLRGVKELHYFDSHDQGMTWPRNDLRKRIARKKAALAEGRAEDALGLVAELGDLKAALGLLRAPYDETAYLDYLCEGRGGRRLVADVTPSYSLLSSGRLRRMAALMPDVRFLYVLRDPLDRLWSHIRMIARRRGGDGRSPADRAATIFDDVVAGSEPEIARRSDYAGALERLRGGVDPARLMIAFYEELLTAPGIAALCSFLGIAQRPGDFDRQVHRGIALDMMPAQAQAARDWLRPQYDYVEQTMGRLPTAWRRALTEV